MDEYVEEGLKNGSIKACPLCGILGELASGCNYIKCPSCSGEWCWQCSKKKYKGEDACNDKSHNSH